MSLLLFGFLLFHLSSCESVKQSGLENAVKYDQEETLCSSEKLKDIGEKIEDLESKLEAKNEKVENLQKENEEMKVQLGNRDTEVANLKKHFAEMESKMEEVMLRSQASLKTEMGRQCKAEVKKELDRVLPTAVEQGLRDLPFEMVCAFKGAFYDADSVVTYDRITVQPWGGGGTMNIETGVFTTVTSGYYVVTFSTQAHVHAGEYTDMWLAINHVKVGESKLETMVEVGSGFYPVGGGYDWIRDQGSRTVVSITVFNISLQSNISHSDSSPAGWRPGGSKDREQ